MSGVKAASGDLLTCCDKGNTDVSLGYRVTGDTIEAPLGDGLAEISPEDVIISEFSMNDVIGTELCGPTVLVSMVLTIGGTSIDDKDIGTKDE